MATTEGTVVMAWDLLSHCELSLAFPLMRCAFLSPECVASLCPLPPYLYGPLSLCRTVFPWSELNIWRVSPPGSSFVGS